MSEASRPLPILTMPSIGESLVGSVAFIGYFPMFRVERANVFRSSEAHITVRASD
jgi:hypothetical protein